MHTIPWPAGEQFGGAGGQGSSGELLGPRMNVKCPICQKPVEWAASPWKPFCSERCKLADLGAWAQEDYFIPGRPEEEEDAEERNEGEKGGH